jgi:biopolymer transport protein ExbD
MSKFDVSENLKQRPIIQLAPLVDIAFWALIFFMIIAMFSQTESQMDITVPKSSTAKEASLNSGKVIINITRNGQFSVNQQKLNASGLSEVLQKVTKLFPSQQVIIRADELVYHKFVVQALDACTRAGITDVSFSTVKDENP